MTPKIFKRLSFLTTFASLWAPCQPVNCFVKQGTSIKVLVWDSKGKAQFIGHSREKESSGLGTV